MKLPNTPWRDNRRPPSSTIAATDLVSIVVREQDTTPTRTGAGWRRAGTVAAAAALVAAAAAVGAQQGVDPASPAGSPRTDLVATTLPVPTEVLAPPSGFPNLDGLTDVSEHHHMDMHYYPEDAFQTPDGLSCRLVTTRGGTSADCYGPIPGLEQPANHVFADEHQVGFGQAAQPSDADLRDAKILRPGEQIVFGPGGDTYGGDQVTCGAQDAVLACILVKQYAQNHGDHTSTRTGFVLSARGSRTFQLPRRTAHLDDPAEKLTRDPPKR
jgi:hypothetical protein